MASTPPCPLLLLSLLLSHRIQATWASLLFLKQSRVTPAPGPLHVRWPQLTPCRLSLFLVVSFHPQHSCCFPDLPVSVSRPHPHYPRPREPASVLQRTYQPPLNYLRWSFVVVIVVFSWKIEILIFLTHGCVLNDNSDCGLYTTCDMCFSRIIYMLKLA